MLKSKDEFEVARFDQDLLISLDSAPAMVIKLISRLTSAPKACVASPELLQVLLLGKRCWKRFVGFQPSAEIDGATRLPPPRYLEAHSALRDRRAPLGTVSAACASIRPEVATRRVPGDA